MKVYAGSSSVEVNGVVTHGTGTGPVVVYAEGATVEVFEQTPDEPISPSVLRQLMLGRTGPYVASVKLIETGEHSTYNRRDTLALFYTQQLRGWGWMFAQGFAPAVLPRMRLMIDGEPATDWREPGAGGVYYFDVDVPNGHHVGYPQAEGMDIRPLGVPFIVNDSGALLPKQEPWTCTKRFDADSGVPCVAVQMRYVEGFKPVTRALKLREVKSYGNRIERSKLWGRHCTTNTYRPMGKRWAQTPDGDVCIEAAQKYFHSTATTGNATAPRTSPHVTLRDGPRGIGTLGYICDMRIRSGGNGMYWLDSDGRFGLLKWDGQIITELGPRLKGLQVHGHVTSSGYMHYSNQPLFKAHQKAYDDAWEWYGDWSQVKGAHLLWEPWGFAVASRRADGTTETRDGHEFWVADTRHHRIVFLDHWTAHGAAGFQKAHFPPPGYVQAEGPTGTSTVANFLGSHDGTPTPECNEPWQCKVSPFDGKLYWTNFAGNSIYRCNLDSSEVEPVLICALQPTDAQLTIRSRLDQSITEPRDLRPLWVRDGAAGVASCVRPTGFDFDSQGNIVFVEHYTYAIRRLELATSTVTTLAALVDVNGGSESSGNAEPNLVVDRDGTCGPVDDIFLMAWSNGTDKRFDRNGVRVEWPSGTAKGALFFNGGNGELAQGPANMLFAPNYAWGLDVWGGRIVAAGNAAGSQFIELTQKLPDDPAYNQAQWRRGQAAYYAAGYTVAVTGTTDGQNELGFETGEWLSKLPDAELSAHLASLGVAPEGMADCIYYVRWCGVNHI